MLRIAAAAIAVLAVAGTPAEARAPGRTISGDGVRITIPSSWRRAGVLSSCSDPHQVLALARSRYELPAGNASHYRGGLVLVLESSGNNFPARQRFRLAASPTRFEGCCDQPTGPGYEFTFRERGRDFYALIDAPNRAVGTEAVAILNTLQINAR
jgi:hypothetical protein